MQYWRESNSLAGSLHHKSSERSAFSSIRYLKYTMGNFLKNFLKTNYRIIGDTVTINEAQTIRNKHLDHCVLRSLGNYSSYHIN